MLPVGHLEQWLHTCMLLTFARPEGFRVVPEMPGPWDMLQCSQDDLALHFDISFVQSIEIFCFSLHLLFSVKLCQYRKTTYVQVSSETNRHHMTPPRSICWMRSVPKHRQLGPPASLHWCSLKIAVPWNSIFADSWSVTSHPSKTKKAACLNFFPLPSLGIKLSWTEVKKMCLIGIFTCWQKSVGTACIP